MKNLVDLAELADLADMCPTMKIVEIMQEWLLTRTEFFIYSMT